jgi:mono/diheme cytochrome c family protein
MMRRDGLKGIPAMASIVVALTIGLGARLFCASSFMQAPRPALYSPYVGAGNLLRPVAFAETPGVDPQVSARHGAEIYQARCSLCHGADLKGVAPGFPSLLGVTNRLSDAQIFMQIRNGKGRMLAFPDLSDDDLHSLLLFLKAPPNPSQPASSEKPGA